MSARGLERHCMRTVVMLVLALLGGAPGGWSAPPPPAAAPPAARPEALSSAGGVKRALLIGINNYKAVPHLMGSLNDVATMEQILITRWGFAPENIKTLTEEAATRDGILTALRASVQQTGPSDTLVVHYSGHGSQVQDLNGDEEDGLDETLVPYDGRTPGVPDIVDDELDVIFAKLHAGAVLIVLDSCHSGTATRSVEFRARGIPQDKRIDLYQQSALTTRAIVPRVESRFLVMSAVAADQEALDGPIDSEYHGIFTYALSKSLAASPPGTSPREVFGRVAEELKHLQTRFNIGAMPEPQLEGPPAQIDAPLLTARGGAAASTASASARLAWLEVQPGPAGIATLVRGALLGAAPGSTWAVYHPGETAFAPGRALAVATVTENVGLDAHATLQPATAIVEPNSRAAVLMSAPAGARTPVRIVDAPTARRRQIEEVLHRTIKDVDIVGTERPARFLIDEHDNTLRLLAADGRQVVGTFDARSDQWGPAVARVISRSVTASGLLALDNPGSQLGLHAQVVGTSAAAARDIVVVADTQPAALHIRRQNEARAVQNSLQISVSVSKDAYLTIVDVDSEGNTNLLFPNSYQRADFFPEGRVPGNQPLLIPDSLTAGSRAGFFWDYGPPSGVDTIRVFASTDLATAQLIRERIRALQAPQGTRGIRAESAPPAASFAALRGDLTRLATRGIVMTQDVAQAAEPAPATLPAASPDWTAASLIVTLTN